MTILECLIALAIIVVANWIFYGIYSAMTTPESIGVEYAQYVPDEEIPIIYDTQN